MKKFDRSDFTEFSGDKKPLLWRLQAFFIPSIKFYYNEEQGSYCRKIINVRGEIRLCEHQYIGKEGKGMCFVPNDWRHPFLKYHQMIWDSSLS